MVRYSEELLKVLFDYKKRIVSNCEFCAGTGYLMDREEDVLCNCMLIFRYVKALVIAGIPTAYWHLRLQELTDVERPYRLLVEDYLRHFNNALDQALGFFLLGSNGIGKTALLCEIGKYAIVRGYTVRYFTAQRYVNACHQNDTEQFTVPRVILFDEIEKTYVKEGSNYVPKMLEDFLRRVISEGRVVIAASNEDEQELEKLFGVSTMSMVRRHLKIVSMEGADRSDQMQRSWMGKLKKEYDFMHSNIVYMAKLKKKYDEDK